MVFIFKILKATWTERKKRAKKEDRCCSGKQYNNNSYQNCGTVFVNFFFSAGCPQCSLIAGKIRSEDYEIQKLKRSRQFYIILPLPFLIICLKVHRGVFPFYSYAVSYWNRNQSPYSLIQMDNQRHAPFRCFALGPDASLPYFYTLHHYISPVIFPVIFLIF